ncbi:P-aminobenzoate N-oxygenase AurF [Nocardioides sp. YR527]|uniref:AurF N-oxygenase family protein n=1 Tax=Nocardioides sp. YR527 TaxID=1881028 RepID=UPI00088B5317|nr:diiron oxygenase [Nocardioides sp. YR527]SDL00610.1 P-aminobenzoate N-oxygenase AurF [Nocardioides sp. YR527]
MVVQTLRSIGGYVGAVAGTPVRMITPTRPLPRREYDQTLRTLSEASVEMYFNAFKDVDWDAPEMAVPEDDERWILPTLDLLGAHPWYQSLPRARQIEVGRHRLTAMVKTGSQFEQLLLLGGTQFLMGVDNGDPEFRYFMHELTEETHHIQMFQEFTNRVCPDVAGAPGWLMRAIPLVGHLGGLYPALFFAIILAGEEPIDHVQKEAMRAGGTHPLLDQIMAIHIAEEARHIGFAHAWLEEHAPSLNPVSRLALGVLTPLAMRLGSDAIIIPSRADRELMGLPDSVVREVWGTGAEAAAFRRHLFADVRMLFDNLGLRTPLTRWSWKVLGVDGRPARFRAEPPSAAA